MITPELFGLKYAWQYTKWFEAKDKKKRLVEAARRAKVSRRVVAGRANRYYPVTMPLHFLFPLLMCLPLLQRPGVPLKEVFLDGSDAEFEQDWESEDEIAEGEGAGVATERPFGAAEADEDAANDPTGLTAAALAVARGAGRAGALFPEPNYDSEGRPLDETGDRVARMKASQGITPQELALGKSASQVYDDYERWVEQEQERAEEEEAEVEAEAQAAASSLGSSWSPPPPLPPLLDSSIDDGERYAENAYIRALVIGAFHPESTAIVPAWQSYDESTGRSSSTMEALYYALIRKRRRLERGGALYAAALAKHDSMWGPWLSEVDAYAFGAPQMSSTGGVPLANMPGNAGGGLPGGPTGAATTLALTPAQQAARQRAAEQEAVSRRSMDEIQGSLMSSIGVKPGTSTSDQQGQQPAVDDERASVATLFASLSKKMKPSAPAATPAAADDDSTISDANLLHASRLKDAARAVPLPKEAIDEAFQSAYDEKEEKDKKKK
jgi:hypothetical protein